VISSHQNWTSLRANALHVLVAQASVPLLSVALVISIARVLGVAEFGRYTELVTWFVLLETLKSLGLPALMVREVARNREDALAYYTSTVRIGLIGAIPAIAILLVLARATDDVRGLAPAACICFGLLPSRYSSHSDKQNILPLSQPRRTAFVSWHRWLPSCYTTEG
jgi:O-antigen/teichoic acid export membrane protein